MKAASLCKFLKTQGVERQDVCLWYKEVVVGGRGSLSWVWKALWRRGSDDTTESWLEGKPSETLCMKMQMRVNLVMASLHWDLAFVGERWDVGSQASSGNPEAVVLKQVMWPLGTAGHIWRQFRLS